MKPGPRPTPVLQVVRAGNPGHRPIKPSVVIPDDELAEPNWLEIWPATRDKELQPVNQRARDVARDEWRRVLPVLRRAAGLGAVDLMILRDYCVCVARLDECERDISKRGLLVSADRADRGLVRNPSTTVAAQYRTQLARYIGELGLSPSARGRLTPQESNRRGADPFAAVG